MGKPGRPTGSKALRNSPYTSNERIEKIEVRSRFSKEGNPILHELLGSQEGSEDIDLQILKIRRWRRRLLSSHLKMALGMEA